MVDDGEATPNKSDGAGSQQQENRLTVVYDKTQSPTTTDFSPIIRAIQATQPRNRLICLLPAGQSRPDPINARERTQYEGVLRYDDWCAERLDQDLDGHTAPAARIGFAAS